MNNRPWEDLVPKGFLLVAFPSGRETALSEDRAMPRILVALNDSCGGEKALEAAVKLAQQDGGRLTAVTVLEQTGNPGFCTIWSLCGVPAITIPVGFGPRGLPLGLQIVGAEGKDGQVLAAAHWCERLFPFSPLR